MPDGLGDAIINMFLSTVTKVAGKFTEQVHPYITDQVKDRIAHSIIEPEMFKTPMVQEMIKELKEEMSHSPKDMGDVGEAILKILIGFAAEVQFEGLTDVEVSAETPYLSKMFLNMALITDLNLVCVVTGILAEVFSIGQIDTIGQELRSYIEYSGASQITQFGYGMVLSSALTPLVAKEINAQTQHMVFDEQTSIRLKFRGLIVREQALDDMNKLGYTLARAQTLLNGSWFYPSPTDFIRFAVREVFRDDVVTKYGYDDDFPIDEVIPPDQLPEWMDNIFGEKPSTLRDLINIGMLDEATLKWYWRSHWELPSPQMGYEMLHRKIITTEELETLLKIQDFAPFWIPHMIGISYSPYTRVDARRMYELGTLTDTEYVTALEEIGYPNDKALKMLEWTILRKMSPERDLTRTMIMNAFVRGLKDRAWTITQLEALGYANDEAELIVGLKEFDMDEEELQDSIDVITLRFVNGLITKEEATGELDKLGLSEIRKLRVLTSAETQIAKLLALPTKADLTKWFTNNLISETVFTERMSKLGFLNDDIDIYVQEVHLKTEE